MKKLNLFNYCPVIFLMILMACNHEENGQIPDENEIKLTSLISISSTRGTNLEQQSTQIVEGQQVGITIEGAQATHHNVAWIVGEEGKMTSNQPVYWNDTKVGITAYHPYDVNWTGTKHVFTVSERQDMDAGYLNSDLLWASTTAHPTDNPIALTFAHKLAKINIKLTSDVYSSLSNAKISICSTKTSVEFNPVTGELGTISNETDILAAVTTTDACTATAIVVPQTINGGTKFIQIVLGNKTFHFLMPSTKTFVSGRSYTYLLELKENSLIIDSDGISDWEDEIVSPDGDEKKLTGVTIDSSNRVTFTYDDKGRLVSWGGSVEEGGVARTFDYTLTWQGNTCMETCDFDESFNFQYTFEDKMVKTTRWNDDYWVRTFIYNESNQVIRIDNTYPNSKYEPSYDTYYWEDGKLTQIVDDNGDVTEIAYSGINFKGHNPAIFLYGVDVLEDVNMVVSHPELFGLKINNLVSRITAEDGDTQNVADFSYSFDNEGYIKDCIVVEKRYYVNGQISESTDVYTFEWK